MANFKKFSILQLIKTENKVLRGFKWTTTLKISTRILDFIRLLVVARLLSPSAIGTFVLATTIINTFNSLSETGISYAAVYDNKNLSTYTKTLLIINSLRGLLISGILFSLSGLLSNFFNNPELLYIIATLSLLPLIQGLENPSILEFQKKLNFKKDFTYRLVPAIFNAFFSIFFSFIFHSSKGLALGLLIGMLVQTIFSYFIITPNLSSPVKISYVKRLFSYSKWISFGGVFAYLTSQTDNFFIGKVFGSHWLGLYDIAFKLANIAFSELSDILSRVLFPAFAEFRNNYEKIRKIFSQTSIFLTIAGIVPLLIFIFIPKFLLYLVFGPKWVDAASILSILSIYGFLRCATNPIGPLFLGLGKPHILSVMNFLQFMLILLFIFPLSSWFGVIGVAYAMVMAYILVQPYQFYNLHKLFKKK